MRHGAHEVDALAAAYRPAVQFVQDAFVLPGWCCPAAQSTQPVLAPARPYRPASHVTHDALSVLDSCPSRHDQHEVLPVCDGWYLPIGHASHVTPPPAD